MEGRYSGSGVGRLIIAGEDRVVHRLVGDMDRHSPGNITRYLALDMIRHHESSSIMEMLDMVRGTSINLRMDMGMTITMDKVGETTQGQVDKPMGDA